MRLDGAPAPASVARVGRGPSPFAPAPRPSRAAAPRRACDHDASRRSRVVVVARAPSTRSSRPRTARRRGSSRGGNAADVADRVRSDPGRDDRVAPRGDAPPCRDEWVVFTKDPSPSASRSRTPRRRGARTSSAAPRPAARTSSSASAAEAWGEPRLGARSAASSTIVRSPGAGEARDEATAAPSRRRKVRRASSAKRVQGPEALESTTHIRADVCFLCAPRWASAVAIANADGHLAEARPRGPARRRADAPSTKSAPSRRERKPPRRVRSREGLRRRREDAAVDGGARRRETAVRGSREGGGDGGATHARGDFQKETP